MKQHLLLSISVFCVFIAIGQSGPAPAQDKMPPGGAWARLEIQNGDSTFVMALRPVKISARRRYKDLDEQRTFIRYTFAARKVYPYALQAIDLYEQIEAETSDLNKRQRRRFIRHENKEAKEDMKETMKNLSKTEGKVLIKMIESQLDQPFYKIIKDTRGTVTAAYWNTLGKMWGYDLKEGYQIGEDILLDDILLDYDFGDPAKLYGG